MPNAHVPADGEAMPEATAVLAVTPQMRSRLAATCEALIALLDEIDGDENLEDTGDDEPLLGWPAGCHKSTAEMSCDDDREHDDCDLEIEPSGYGDEEGMLVEEWGEPELGFCGHGTGWREGETTDDREQENEHRDDSDFEPFLGWSEIQSQHGAEPTGEEFPIEGGGSAKPDGSGVRIAKKMLNESARRRKASGRKGEVLFRRDDPIIPPRYATNDQWTGNLPPEAHEVLIPEIDPRWVVK